MAETNLASEEAVAAGGEEEDGRCGLGEYGIVWRIMSAIKTISFRMAADKVESLDELAERMDRDRSYLLNEAVQQYLELNEYHIGLIQKGLRAAEAGDLVPEAEMKKLVGRMRRAK